MKLYVLFEQPEELYPGQYAPTAVTVLDEHTMGNPGVKVEDAQEQEVLRLLEVKALTPERLDKIAWIGVDLGTAGQLIRDTILHPTPTIQGSVAVPVSPQGQKHSSYAGIKVTQGRPGAGRIVDDEIVE